MKITYPLTITIPEELTTTSSVMTFMRRVNLYVDSARRIAAISGEFRLSAVGVTGGKVRVDINGLQIFETAFITSNSYIIFNQKIDISSFSFPQNSVWQVDVYIMSESGKTAYLRGFSIVLV